MKPGCMAPAPPPILTLHRPKASIQLPPLTATLIEWKNKKPRLPSGDPYLPVAPMPDVPRHGPSRTLPGMVAGTCVGVGEPPGHRSAGEVTPLTVLPSGL